MKVEVKVWMKAKIPLINYPTIYSRTNVQRRSSPEACGLEASRARRGLSARPFGMYADRPLPRTAELACLHCPGRELSIKLLIRALSHRLVAWEASAAKKCVDLMSR